MRNRDAILKKIESIESNLNKLNFSLNHGDINLYNETIEKLFDQTSQIRTWIESEPIDGFELNPNR
jgi:prephenate dehydrogenase